MSFDEPLRPQYHFSPPEKWMNDPNGLVYYVGEFHLFYQHNPSDTVWGPMHWGHAVSADLVNWQHLPIALYPDDLGTIFSGSAVIDWQNTAGFGDRAMIAFFTHDSPKGQKQSLAYSTDKGRTWTKYDGNPVIDTPAGQKDFRDPKVFGYGTREGAGHWVMLVAAGNRIWFYASPDLVHWTKVSEFGPGYGSHGGVWETPDLFELPVDGGPEKRWTLTVGIGRGAPAGGSGMQYFVGDFDGTTFTSLNPPSTVLWADYGADFYAAQGWNDAPDERRIWIAWMNNWTYAREIPTSTWRGAMTLPRDLALTSTPAGIRLMQRPIPELQQLRGKQWSWQDQSIEPANNLLAQVQGELLEIMAGFQVDTAGAERFGFRVRKGDQEATTIGYVPKNQTLFVDRTQSGQVDFSPNFRGVHTAAMPPVDDTLHLHIFVDRSSVEVFGNHGLVSMTGRIFPEAGSRGVEVFAENGQVLLKSLDIYELNPASMLRVQD